MLPRFEYAVAHDLADALDAVAEGAVPYCGGTELIAAMGMGLLMPERIVSLRGVAELRGITQDSNVLRLGATTTHREVMRSPVVCSAAPLLADVARRIGNARVRASGTIGGNLVFAEPRSDLSTALIALGCDVVLATSAGTRRVRLVDFLEGAYETDLRPSELLVRVEVPARAAEVGIYRKVTITERPVVGVALVRLVEGPWRLVVGAVGETPVVVEATELSGLDADAIADAVDVLEDVGTSTEYKRHLARVTVARCIDDAYLELEGKSA